MNCSGPLGSAELGFGCFVRGFGKSLPRRSRGGPGPEPNSNCRGRCEGHAVTIAIGVSLFSCQLLEAYLRAKLECRIFGAARPLIWWMSGGFRPPGAVATEIRADWTLIRRELALPRSDSTRFRHCWFFLTLSWLI